jgi:hypothetical protein
MIGSGVVPEAAAHLTRFVNRIMPSDASDATRGQYKSRQDAQECGFARAVCTQERQRLTFVNFERNAG